jgi:metacaspase-1
MPKGLSLQIGLNYVDPDHYDGWDGKLNACEKDATDMEMIASSQGFDTKVLLRDAATRENVLLEIKMAADTLTSGDIFYLSYSGHGGQIPDANNDEPDGQDETWCLFDGQLIDDELKEYWTFFERGVRIFITSDSCHSGTIIKSANNHLVSYTDQTPRYMEDSYSLSVYMKNKDFYDGLIEKVPNVKSSEIKASVLLISGCQDNQYSYDGAFNGVFTWAMKRIWNGGNFNGNYIEYHKQILNLLPAFQSPNYSIVGEKNEDFENQKPFFIG